MGLSAARVAAGTAIRKKEIKKQMKVNPQVNVIRFDLLMINPPFEMF
jgi:uncharacterized protein YneF (UPF0154 family)